MGCASSAAAECSDWLASGPATKRFFYLDDLPLSICASPEGRSSITVRIVVPADAGWQALWRLEQAFERRGLQMMSAQMSRVAGLVQLLCVLKGVTGHLAAFQFASPVKTWPGLAGSTLQLKAKPAELPRWACPCCTDSSSESVKGGATDDAILQLSTEAGYKVGSHAALLRAAEAAGASAVAAQFSTLGASFRDELWLKGAAAGEEALSKLRSDFQMSFYQVLDEMSTLDGTYAYAQGFHTPKKVHLASSVGGLVSAISEWDSQEVVAHAEGLPRAVRGALRGVPYELRLCEHGFQADGFSKFAGAGWIPAETAVLPDEVKGKAVELPPTLEIRSVFVPERLGSKERDPSKDAATARRDALWQRWMSSGKKYAEFVTWLDVPARSWTIYKVFLNDVLPGGKNYGAKAVAEHLASDPRTFFGQGDLQQADLPEFARAVTDLETIKICDVVNWNTYVLMAIVASPTRNIDMFGEHMAPLLSQELAASRTSAAELQSASPLEVFVRTALGKMTKKIIQIWNARFGLSLYIKSVSVSFVRGAQERIIGELRDMMILRVGIAQEGGQCGDTTAVSVSEAMAVDTVEVGHNVDKLDDMVRPSCPRTPMAIV